MSIQRISDKENNITYILLNGLLDNGYELYISIPAMPIEESVQISNQALIIIGIIILLISAFISSFVSKKFTAPIVQLNDITNKMARLDFSQKYRIVDTDDEINEYFNSVVGIIMLESMARKMEEMQNKNKKKEKSEE